MRRPQAYILIKLLLSLRLLRGFRGQLGELRQTFQLLLVLLLLDPLPVVLDLLPANELLGLARKMQRKAAAIPTQKPQSRIRAPWSSKIG